MPPIPCAEIDASITGLQWLREKYVNSTRGDRVIHAIGNQGQGIDVRALQEKWEKHKMYRAVPEGAEQMVHLLARGAQYAAMPEDRNALLKKLVEVLEFVWPTSGVQQHSAFNVANVVVLIPVGDEEPR
jgi:hypothetical protein